MVRSEAKAAFSDLAKLAIAQAAATVSPEAEMVHALVLSLPFGCAIHEALQNPYVRDCLENGQGPLDRETVSRVFLHEPPVRLNFQHGIVFGSYRDILSPRAKKGWERKLGSFKEAEFIRPDDYFCFCKTGYVYLDTAPRKITFRRRMAVKKALKGVQPSMVVLARRDTKKGFLEAVECRRWSSWIGPWLDKIKELGYEGPEHFWRAVHGTQPLPPAVQEIYDGIS